MARSLDNGVGAFNTSRRKDMQTDKITSPWRARVPHVVVVLERLWLLQIASLPKMQYEKVGAQGPKSLLGGSWDLVSKVVSTFIGVVIKYNYRYLADNPNY